MTALSHAFEAVRAVMPMRIVGRVAALRGLTVLVEDLPLPVGSLVSIHSCSSQSGGGGALLGEVVAFTQEQTAVMVLGQTTGIRPGDTVVGEEAAQTAPVGAGLLGRVVDGLGRPIDGLGPIRESVRRPISPEPVPAMLRKRISEQLITGVRALDLMIPVGKGQRLGLFAGPGVGKSTLLGTIARRARSDVNVIALIGERGREVKDFIEQSLGQEGLNRSVVVVATGDESPLLRIRAARLACTAAEYFRSRGQDVLLLMDSVTRFAHAQRQVGLSVGEPPATKGYTPSVFSSLALLLERAGSIELSNAGGRGSITGLYTILVEGDDMTEPVADAVRGILDGHVVLSRKLAQRAHYPAIDVLDSVSRVADDVTDRESSAGRRQLMRLLAAYRDVEDLVQIGAYSRGSSVESDVAIDYNREVGGLMRQGSDDVVAFEQAKGVFLKLAAESARAMSQTGKQRQR